MSSNLPATTAKKTTIITVLTSALVGTVGFLLYRAKQS